MENEKASQVNIELVREWLLAGSRTQSYIYRLEREKKTELDRITAITASLVNPVVAGTKDPHKFDRYCEYVEEIEKTLIQLQREKAARLKAINTVKAPVIRECMMLRFCSLDRHGHQRTVSSIAKTMNYSEIQIYRYLHSGICILARDPQLVKKIKATRRSNQLF